MGAAKELMFELQQERAIARSLGIDPAGLQGHAYQIREDGHRTLIVWDGDAPAGVVTIEERGEQVSEVDLSEPDGPDHE